MARVVIGWGGGTWGSFTWGEIQSDKSIIVALHEGEEELIVYSDEPITADMTLYTADENGVKQDRVSSGSIDGKKLSFGEIGDTTQNYLVVATNIEGELPTEIAIALTNT